MLISYSILYSFYYHLRYCKSKIVYSSRSMYFYSFQATASNIKPFSFEQKINCWVFRGDQIATAFGSPSILTNGLTIDSDSVQGFAVMDCPLLQLSCGCHNCHLQLLDWIHDMSRVSNKNMSKAANRIQNPKKLHMNQIV